MAHVRLDKKPEVDVSVDHLKVKLNNLQIKLRAFMNSYKFMKIKDRVQKLDELTQSFQSLNRDMEKFKSLPITNTGVKFAFETFRQSFNLFLPKWKKFETELLALSKDE